MERQYEIRDVALAVICVDEKIQPRDHIDEATVAEYADAIESGAQFPPIDIFEDKTGKLLLASGEQRLRAYHLVNSPQIGCRVFQGEWHDAWIHARGANKHGKNLTIAEKQRTAREMLLDQETGRWSDSRIARHIGVSHTFVGKIRQQVSCNVAGYPGRLVQRGDQNYIMQPASYHDQSDEIEQPILLTYDELSTQRALIINSELEVILDQLIAMGSCLREEIDEFQPGELEMSPLEKSLGMSAETMNELMLLSANAEIGIARNELMSIINKIVWEELFQEHGMIALHTELITDHTQVVAP